MVDVRVLEESDREWVRSTLRDHWGSSIVVGPGRVWHDVSVLPGFLAEEDGSRLGLVLYEVRGDETEVVVLVSAVPNRGSGAAVVEAVERVAREAGCRRLVVVTTNDNVHALRFYQRHGWDLAALHRNGMDEVRRIKPDVPLIGREDIALRHMFELERIL